MSNSKTRLYVIKGPMRGNSFPIENDSILIGRSAESDIQLRDDSISRVHARLLRNGDLFFIEDMQSRNGIWINGKRIRSGVPVQINEGLLLALGNVLISLGREYSENGMVTRYSIDLSGQATGGDTEELYKNRRITSRTKLELIYEVCTTLMQTLDINEIVEKIMNALFDCLKRIDNGAIILVDPRTGAFDEVIARSRDRSEPFELNYSRTIVDRVIKEGKAVMLSDTSLENEDDLSLSIQMMQIKSVMCVPLMSQSRPRGVIYVHSVNVPNGFRKDDLFLLTALSSPAALAIENALLYSRSRQTEQALEKIRDGLEERVLQRTAELSEANRNLGLAYARMRDWKDQLSSQLHGEEIGVLVNGTGLILASTDRAMEVLDVRRSKLPSTNLLDLVDHSSREGLRGLIAGTRTGFFQQTSIRLGGGRDRDRDFQAKLMHLNAGKGCRMVLVLMRRPDRWKNPDGNGSVEL